MTHTRDIPHLALAETFGDVDALTRLAHEIEVTTRIREEENGRPPMAPGDMAALAARCYGWFTHALDQLDSTEAYEIPGILFIYREGGIEQMVYGDQATRADLVQATTSRMAEAMACMAEAWWAIQQAAFLYDARDGSADE